MTKDQKKIIALEAENKLLKELLETERNRTNIQYVPYQPYTPQQPTCPTYQPFWSCDTIASVGELDDL